ncbi:hypothetical protein [Hymenobacter norwichensis]|uniref:hypothetical protein n=1 Tax=Hymenobacter norwichensis TaxID=223903 RepID=UPI00146C02DD|nr:hypothetical protein [Hymenobacter norwichensis]
MATAKRFFFVAVQPQWCSRTPVSIDILLKALTMKKAFSILLLLVGAAVSQSCEKKAETPCVMGTLLGTTCAGGYLVQVDTTSQVTIGEPVGFQGDAGGPLSGPAVKNRVYNNVIMTYTALPAMQRGQRFYFQYEPDSEVSSRICTANMSWYEAPKYNLLGISNTSCSTLLPE